MTAQPLDFLVIGAQKAGTTSLHNYLGLHPNILLPRRKELHFFDNEHIWRGVTAQISYQSYNSLLEDDPGRRQLILNKATDPAYRRGEVTPIYMYWYPCLERIQAYNPNIKLIMVLRNPITRALSHYRMELARNAETLDLWHALNTEPQRLAAEPHRQHRVYSYADRGFYTRQIARVRQLFPSQQLLVVLSDDLDYDKVATLNKLCNFLGLDGIYGEAMLPKLARHHVGSGKVGCSSRELDFLKNLFAGEIGALSRLLGRDLSHWLEVEADTI